MGLMPLALIQPEIISSMPAPCGLFYARSMPKQYDPTEGMSPLELLLAGVGQGMNNTYSGVKQAFGALSKDDIKALRELDSPLLNRGMGQVGSVLGQATAMAPAAFIPGANTVAGAGLVGAGLGLLQPSETTGETLQNAATLGLLGPANIVGGRAVGGLLSSPQAMRGAYQTLGR